MLQVLQISAQTYVYPAVGEKQSVYSELAACFTLVVKAEKLLQAGFALQCVLKCFLMFWKTAVSEVQRTLKKPDWSSCKANSLCIAHSSFVWYCHGLVIGNAKAWGLIVTVNLSSIYAWFTVGYIQVSVRWSL